MSTFAKKFARTGCTSAIRASSIAFVKNPRIIIGDYTYYDDVDGADQFEEIDNWMSFPT